MRKLLVGSVLLVLLFFSGCLKINYDAQQTFRDDGKSTLALDESISLSKEYFESLGSLSSAGSPSTIMLMLMVDYYGSQAYPTSTCSLMRGPDVKSCTPNDDGSLSATVALSPGEFYTFDKETDWVALKEIKTYKIERVPLATYYAVKGRSSEEYNELTRADLRSYMEDNIDQYLDKDIYCLGSTYSLLTCDFLSYGGGTANVVLNTSSYTPRQVEWVACSNYADTHYIFLNASEARAELGSVVEMNRTLEDGSPISVSLSCPAGSKSLVIAYQQKYSYSTTVSEYVDAFQILSKDEMKQEVLDSLDTSYSSSSTTSSLEELDADKYFIDFEEGTILGSDLEDMGVLGDTYGDMLDVKYTAVFPERIVSATVGREDLEPEGNTIEFDLSDLQDLPENELVVVTETDLSPLGIFTWVLLFGVLLVGILVVVFVLKGMSAAPPPRPSA